ncbi:FAD-dependent thymidylate synthase [Anaerovorax sp. IOR16]|uniref:FAD-dependent thymidylate synthase n=1 Tax=Anaerovorax sp. IOR16 TaxID=2773458 RepID=UPI0019D1E2CF|nr:FAD-dependent thymidylate synthase [Anaerovorax sp. IOR16]
MDLKTQILKIKGTWQDVVDDCRNTVSKPPLGKEPSKEFKRNILISEHSPIRDISIRWKWEAIKSWISVHWVRHKWECFVSTQRTDRTGVNRDNLPQSTLLDFVGDANIQQLIDTMRKRLCFQASKETREYAEDFKSELHKYEPEIADVLVPNCVYRCGCPECTGENKCKAFENLLVNMQLKDVNVFNIQERYDAYNEWFYSTHK